MFDTLSALPITFWFLIALVIWGVVQAFKRINDGTGIPTLAVLGTVVAWYVGDAFYNDYPNNHAKLFTSDVLFGAWLQVAWFVAVFVLLVPPVHVWINRSFLRRRSGVLQMFKHGVDQPVIQRQLNAMFTTCASVWFVLFLIAVLVLKGEVRFYLFPFLGYKASPWVHGRVGAGFDFLSILAVYLNLLVASMFGVVAALATNRQIRRYAIILCLITWPYFIFDRTRNSMLAIVIPAVLCWVFLRLRGGMWKKILVLMAFYVVVNSWMKFVIANRSDMSITSAFKEKGLNLADQKNVHNEGLNMFEELCWVSTFIDNGTYRVNWGARYFAELVNPIPRAIWHGKPLIGLDYAIARGHADENDAFGGVNTTISTGMIGQGVVNFGRIFGPAAAAFLMSLWVATLARLDLTVQGLGRLPLYSLGLILTFNMGRDITLIVLYPFVFGALVVWWLDRHHPQVEPAISSPALAAASPPSASPPSTRRALPAPKPARTFVRRVTMGGFVKRKSSRLGAGRS
jgi:hypothetical protein